mmetsp:Transcript_7935/g.18388  ORF Transcript_7935/g.18388 Transcript_7935/m.18388 type:complete len:221 (-) Transcript_7935:164-826(-)
MRTPPQIRSPPAGVESQEEEEEAAPSQGPEAGRSVPRRARPSLNPEAGRSVPRRCRSSRGGPFRPEAGLAVRIFLPPRTLSRTQGAQRTQRLQPPRPSFPRRAVPFLLRRARPSNPRRVGPWSHFPQARLSLPRRARPGGSRATRRLQPLEPFPPWSAGAALRARQEGGVRSRCWQRTAPRRAPRRRGLLPRPRQGRSESSSPLTDARRSRRRWSRGNRA